VTIPNGTKLQAICEAGGAIVQNDHLQRSGIWEFVIFEGQVGYVPALWTGGGDKLRHRLCGS